MSHSLECFFVYNGFMERNDIKKRIHNLPLKTKLQLLYGDDFWKVRGISELGYQPFLVADGPHGLRRQIAKGDQLGMMAAYPATCFPTASLLACSFDEELVIKTGQIIAREALGQNVAVVLGPGVNIKRNPLCGRNFEYYSEDPLLSGKLGAAFIKGVQSQGVGTSLKHFAANNQESDRLTINAVIDQRALREIYLKPFEIAVKESKPYTIMCSYNRINGTYSSDNGWLLNHVLREEWEYDGLVMTDWGAINDDFLSRKNGMDLEMPGIGKRYKNLLWGMKKGLLNEDDVDECIANLVGLHERVKNLTYGQEIDYDNHHQLARQIAANSMVLLKNSGVLPIKSWNNIAIIGAFAAQPRYQGTGSSKVNPYKLVSFIDALKQEEITCDYAPGYFANGQGDNCLESEAVALAKNKDIVIVFAGLPDAYESEGFDRNDMAMPPSHLSLIEKLCALGKEVIVVLQGGAPLEVPFADKVSAIVMTYLAGQAGGPATFDILSGRINPSGKLPETWPMKYVDTPSAPYFPGDGTNVLYKESIYVGYRYFDTTRIDVRYPFGFGLSYTTFVYQNLDIKYEFVNRQIRYVVSFDLINTGPVAGQEVVQLYVSNLAKGMHKPAHELKGFTKVTLEVNQTKHVSLILEQSDLRQYDVTTHDYILEKGEYVFEIGASSRDIRLSKSINIDGLDTSCLSDESLSSYSHLSYPMQVSDEEFVKVLQNDLPPKQNRSQRPFTKNSTLRDIEKTIVGKVIRKILRVIANKMKGDDVEATRRMFIESAMTMPLRGYTMSGMLTNGMVDGLVHMANRKFFRGLWCMIFKGK